jgi:alpha-beta hydrolase superfamily lysophospholipase
VKIPGRITFARVLWILGGFLAVVNGLIELGPDVGPAAHAIGVPLVVAGAASWWLAWALRSPRRWLVPATVVVATLLIAARVAQYLVVHSPLVLVACVLPIAAASPALRSRGRAWLSMSAEERDRAQSAKRQRRRTLPTVRRLVAATGAVGLTAGILVVGTGAGVAVASAPCTFPPLAASALASGSASSAVSHQAPTGTIRATDGVRLAYYAFVPADPIASLIFYHGSGANSAAGYLPLGRELAAKYHVATYLFDIRGHGASGGPRGDAPSTLQLWHDTATAVSFVHGRQAGIPEFVGGHSAGAGLVLNSVPLIAKDVAGYAFLAPDFGLHSGTEAASNFATICQRPLVATALTNGVLGAHKPAVSFAYTTAQVRNAELVPRYTATMAIGQDASNSAQTLSSLREPLGVWIGAKDEVFDPEKVLGYARKAGRADVTTGIIPGDTHLGILNNGASRIGPWIDHIARTR